MHDRFQPFDLANVSLQRGSTLIEASAGTGKTFSIAGLILRLVLEEGVPVQEILAVTYTVAATQELRERVRRRLHAALEDLRHGSAEDEITRNFLNQKNRAEIADGIRALNLAVQSFDEAHIFTIHGFCQRVLRDRAFESGARFDAELVTDPQPLLEELTRDFWRCRFYESEPLVAALVLTHGSSHADLLALLNRTRNHPGVQIFPSPEPHGSSRIAKDLAAKFEAVRKEWKTHRAEIERLLSDKKTLSQDAKRGFPPKRLAEILQQIDEACGDFEKASPECVAALADICSVAVAAAAKSNQTAPTHHVFDLCEDFRKTVGCFFNQLRHEFLAFAETELPARKLRLNMLTYDDLLKRVHTALTAPNGGSLAAGLGRQYRAALIDEFQDTDPLQHEIFHRLFADDEHWLFFIGDPKQAIYGFRGADVFTYFKAANSATRGYTLTTNWRSEQPLLEAINTLFQCAKHPFVFEQITYRDVRAPAQPRADFIVFREEKKSAPMQFRFVQSAREDGKEMNQEQSVAAVCEAVAADIARLHSRGSQLGEKPLRFRDMAVLVRKHAQAERIQNALRRRGIRSVMQTERSVFQTAEATELQRLLEAVIEPRREGLLKTALATSLIGLNATELAAMECDEALRQTWLDRFLSWRELWMNGCFIATFRKLLVEMRVRERLVQLPAGERRLTDLLHLAELLHGAETERRLTPEGLCGWLRDQRNSLRKGQENHQLRLESDDDAVLIATVHKSKGLEYAVVFCPFLWQPAESGKSETVQFHDRANDDRLTLDLRGKKHAPPQHANAHGAEALAEEMRLLYVAITRAKNRCVIYAGDMQKFDQSPLAHLLSATGEAGETALFSMLEQLAGKSEERIAVSKIDSVSDAEITPDFNAQSRGVKPRARPFSCVIPRVALVTSFSALTAGKSDEAPDRDEVDESDEVAEIAQGIFGFERGPRAGDFLHDVLEHFDFQRPDQLENLLAAKLTAHGFSSTTYRNALRAQLLDLLKVELLPGLHLRAINRRDRLSELEFSHRLPRLDPARLREAFSGLNAEFSQSLGRLKFDPVEGYLRGFIDLLFRADDRYYIVDWKSNWLGNRATDYDADGVRACMARHHYFLQSHLYTLATDLFLASRVPDYCYEKNFGGVFYIFLRGVDSANPGRGIFRDRPNEKTIAALRKLSIA